MNQMKCPKCKFENGSGDHFCGSCGGPLARHVVEKRGVPYWAVALVALCCITLGAVGFSLFKPDGQQSTNSPPEPKDPIVIQTPENKDVEEDKPVEENITKPVVNTSAPVVTKEPLDKITLIKQVSEKVYTIVAGDSLGTGFLYAKGGYVVTNAHVVQGYVDVTVRDSKGGDVAGKVIGISDGFDIALIKVDAYSNVEPLPAEKEASPVGLEVIAFGSPHGFENTASIGYITGTGRDLQADFVYNKLYQVDAQIDVGSSGGPLVDAKTGKVIGINSLVYTDNHSFAFSIPLYTMMPTINEWITTPLSEQVVLEIGQNNEYVDIFDGQEKDYFDFDVSQIEIVENYILLYAEYFESALNEGEFFWVADMLEPETTIYAQTQEDVKASFSEGKKYDYSQTEVVDITYEESHYYVTTNEVYDVTLKDGTVESHDVMKSYTVYVDEAGSIYITEIELFEEATE